MEWVHRTHKWNRGPILGRGKRKGLSEKKKFQLRYGQQEGTCHAEKRGESAPGSGIGMCKCGKGDMSGAHLMRVKKMSARLQRSIVTDQAGP